MITDVCSILGVLLPGGAFRPNSARSESAKRNYRPEMVFPVGVCDASRKQAPNAMPDTPV